MTRSPAEIEQIRNLEAYYGTAATPVVQAVTDAVCGCGYIGTSWTTRDEAEAALRYLGLTRSSHLLELGAGAGWPGLHLARRSGCSATLVDLPETGLAMARERAGADGMRDRVTTIAGDATSLRAADGAFSAINHSDLLCCLQPKREVLEECRRVLRSGGRMTFSAISVAPGLRARDHAEAVNNAPPFVEAEAPYTDMLAQTGWKLRARTDMTAAYEAACERQIRADAQHRADLVDLLGERAFHERQAGWASKLSVIRRRLTLREFYVAEPA